MRKTFFILLSFFLFINFSVLFSKSFSYSNYLPKITKSSNTLVVKIDTLSNNGDFFIYYKTEGLKNYQIRKMKNDKNGKVYYQLSLKNLYGKTIEYLIVKNEDIGSNTISPVFTFTNFTKKESPEVYFASEDSQSTTSSKKREPLLKFQGSLSTASRLHDSSDYPGEKFSTNANMRVYKNINSEKYQFDFDSNFTYMNHVSDKEKKINLTSMMIRYKRGSHKFEAGDVNVSSNNQLAMTGINKRGLNYEFKSKNFYLNSFYTNSQQKTGFDGFGIPSSNASLFGTTIGFDIGKAYNEIIKIRGLFLTGEDDLDSKTVASSEEPFRTGNMYSFWGELNPFKSYLKIFGEYARCNFGKGLDKESLNKEKDNAWRAGGNFNYKVLSASVKYNKIGSKFNSIANLFMQNDREGLNSNLMLNIKTFSFSLNYVDQKSYMESSIQPELHSKNLMANFNWLIANHIKIGAEYGKDNLDYDESTGLQSGGSDMDTLKYGATLGYIAGSNGINLRIGKTESKTFTSNIDASVSINLRLGKFLSFNPTFSYQNTKNLADNSTSKIYNIYLNSELSFIPQLFTLSISGSYNKNKSTSNESESLTANGNFNFYMAKIFKNKIQPILSLRAKYQETKYGGTKTDSVALYLHFDLSF